MSSVRQVLSYTTLSVFLLYFLSNVFTFNVKNAEVGEQGRTSNQLYLDDGFI